MGSVADKYISPGGRQPDYGKSQYTDDLTCLAGFLVWAEDDGAAYGGHKASDAFRAACRLLDIDGVRLRRIMLGLE